MARKRRRQRSEKPRKEPAPPTDDRLRYALWPSTNGKPDWRMLMPDESDDGAIIVAFSVPGGWKVQHLPPGAVLGTISKQNVRGFGMAHPAYVDLPFTCVDCRRPAVFTAEAQRFWYETLGKYSESCATRCDLCRAAHRRARMATQALAELHHGYKAAPSPQNALRIAVLTATMLDTLGEGARQRAIGLARKARKAGLDADAVLVQLGASESRS